MSLLSRILGSLEPADDRQQPESLRRIAAELEALPPERARFLAAFTYVLARVANADMEVDADELRQMERSLASLGELSEEEARLAVQVAVDRAVEVGGTDDYVITRELRGMTDKPERVRLMRCLLAVAASDDSISSHESREVTAIGEELGFSRKEISALRYEFRDKLAETRQRLPGES
jgi:uncharacterized tellurite resistance protein B-like protein